MVTISLIYFLCHLCIDWSTCLLFGQEKPVKTLVTVASLAYIAMITGVITTGIVSVYALMFGGLCCVLLCGLVFFSLGVAGLGKYTSQGFCIF